MRVIYGDDGQRWGDPFIPGRCSMMLVVEQFRGTTNGVVMTFVVATTVEQGKNK